MICSNCETENEAGRKFCDACGASNRASARFCAECATPLPGAEPIRSASAAGLTTPPSVAERRLVSVLFADLVGFTPFAEERDAEEVRETLTRYFDLASDVITRYGGTVEKFIGDAVMAVSSIAEPIDTTSDARLTAR